MQFFGVVLPGLVLWLLVTAKIPPTYALVLGASDGAVPQALISRECDRQPGLGEPLVFVAENVISPGRWIQRGGVVGQGATSSSRTPVRTAMLASAPETGTTV